LLPKLWPTNHPWGHEDNTSHRNGNDSQPRTTRIKEAVQGSSAFGESKETTIPPIPLISYPDGPPFTLATPVGKQSSNYRAEVQALQSTTDYLMEQGVQQRNVVFLTDSLSALQSLSAGPSDTTTRQLLVHLCCLPEHNNVVLQWIPAHVGIAGNEAADKQRRSNPSPQCHTKKQRIY